MSLFFSLFAIVASLGLLSALAIGHWGPHFGLSAVAHMLFGLGVCVFSSLLHCLVFAIFTGSGKDARLLVEELKLNEEYIRCVKEFRRRIFPPALKAIGWLLLLAVLGGATGSGKWIGWLSWIHPAVGWWAVIYNVLVFRKEAIAVAENSRFIGQVNSDAAERSKTTAIEIDPTPEDMVDEEFARHARALGRFLCFLAYNTWLPYLYFRFVMALLWLSWVPFLFVSLGLYLAGQHLQRHYSMRFNRGVSTDRSGR